jgi:hypothetical protein
MAQDEKKFEAIEQREHADTKPESSPDPFDLNRLKLDQSFIETVGIKRVRTHVPVRKPTDQEWVQVNPDAKYRGNFGVIKLKADNEIYLVVREMALELAQWCYPVPMFTVVSSTGIVFLWPVRLPGRDGKDLPAWSTEREAADDAQKYWVQIDWKDELRANEHTISNLTTEPKLPTETFQELLTIAFKGGRLIDSLDHPVVKQLRGLD